MFDDISEAQDAVSLAQDAANRHQTTFYVIAHTVITGGRTALRITSNPPNTYYLEKVVPVSSPAPFG